MLLSAIFYCVRVGIEILVNYDLPSILYQMEAIIGESEGKDQKGIYPASVDFTADHSMINLYRMAQELCLKPYSM